VRCQAGESQPDGNRHRRVEDKLKDAALVGSSGYKLQRLAQLGVGGALGTVHLHLAHQVLVRLLQLQLRPLPLVVSLLPRVPKPLAVSLTLVVAGLERGKVTPKTIKLGAVAGRRLLGRLYAVHLGVQKLHEGLLGRRSDALSPGQQRGPGSTGQGPAASGLQYSAS
jgi:hypothetical protein